MNVPTETIKACQECGATNIPQAQRCWMCAGDLKHAPEFYLATAVDTGKPAWAGGEASHWLPVGLLGGLLALVGIGIYSIESGGLIPYAIVAGPAYLATVIRTTRKQVQHKPMGVFETIATFVISGMAVVGLLAVLLVAAIVCFIVYCFTELARH